MIDKKTRWRYRMAAALMLVACAAGLGAAQTAVPQDRQFQDAYQKEMVAGDLKSAIEAYRAISTRVGVDRALAATALLRMAECYDKLGDPSARAVYDEIVRTYADQPAATTARTRTGSPSRQRVSLSRVNVPTGDLIAAVSDDGRLLAGSDDDTGDLIVRDLRAGTERRVTANPPGSFQYAQEAAFSPDGRFVGYSWFNAAFRYDLRVADLAGGTASRVLYENEEIEWLGAYDWSPDGQSIAIQLRRKDRTAQIALVSVSTGAMRVLKSTDWRGSTGLFFSPDGRYLAFDLPTTPERDDRDVFVLAVDGSRQIAVTDREAGESAVGWMPDGKHVLFARETGGQNALWARAFSNGRFDQAPVLLSAEIGAPTSLGITRSGTLFLKRYTGGNDILVGPTDLKKAASPFTPANATFVLGGDNRNPAWSPDGRWLAYNSFRRGAGGFFNVLVLRSLETGRSRETRPAGMRFSFLQWTADSRGLLLQGTDGQGRGGVHRLDVQTGDVEFIAAGQFPQPSADGARIFFRRNNAGEQAVFEFTLATREERELRRGRERWLRVSPDNQFIVGHTADQRTLVVAPLAGGPMRELLKLPAGERLGNIDTLWTHDGLAIVFRKILSAQENDSEHWLYELATGQTRRITIVPGAVNASLSPDDSRIAVQVNNSLDSELWTLENFSVPAEGSAPDAGGRR